MRASQFIKKDITCPVCLNEEATTLWTAINARTDPDLKERLLRKTLQIHPCSNCGHDILLSTAFMYLDPDARLLIACEPELQNSKDWSPAIDPAQLGDWTVRLTVHSNQLIEKVHIHDSGLDDRLVEVLKLSLLRQENQPVQARQLFFYRGERPDQQLHFMVLAADEKWYNLDLQPQIYTNLEQMIEKLAVKLPEDWIIDQQTATGLLAAMARQTDLGSSDDDRLFEQRAQDRKRQTEKHGDDAGKDESGQSN